MSVRIEQQSGLQHGHENGQQDGEVVNGNVLFSKDSAENAPVKETRIIKKAKRHIKSSPRKDDSDDNTVVPLNMANLALQKNSRKSRNGFGRGLPKKGEFSI